VDVDGFLDVAFQKYMRKMGVKLSPKDLVVCTPRTAEDALAMVMELVNSQSFDLVVLDSLASLTTKKDVSASMTEEESSGDLLKQFSVFFRRVRERIAHMRTTLICTNQLRTRFSPLGPEEVTFGGNSLKYSASIRLEVVSSGEPSPHGLCSTVRIHKNDFGSGLGEENCLPSIQYDLLFGQGIPCEGVADAAIS